MNVLVGLIAVIVAGEGPRVDLLMLIAEEHVVLVQVHAQVALMVHVYLVMGVTIDLEIHALHVLLPALLARVLVAVHLVNQDMTWLEVLVNSVLLNALGVLLLKLPVVLVEGVIGLVTLLLVLVYPIRIMMMDLVRAVLLASRLVKLVILLVLAKVFIFNFLNYEYFRILYDFCSYRIKV